MMQPTSSPSASSLTPEVMQRTTSPVRETSHSPVHSCLQTADAVRVSFAAGEISVRELAARGRNAGMGVPELAAMMRERLVPVSPCPKPPAALTVAAPLRGLRVVMLSDTHGRHRKINVPDGDVLLHAGDFTHYSRLEDAQDFNDWLGTLPHRHKILVVGNHEANADWSHRAASVLTNAAFLRDDAIDVPARTEGAPPLRVYGTDFFWPGEDHAALGALATKRPGTIDILMTHGPVAGFVDGGLGCSLLLEQVERLRPRLVVSGHIHEAHGVTTGSGDVLGSTTFVNAANAQRGHAHMGWPPVVMDV
mmetsp:Transcript_8517/g.21839  ORF Transcript_8517/g.21839 Transcript_8517/m.21839 type:complete len:307 (+) Transcript_8517:34-954(+)